MVNELIETHPVFACLDESAVRDVIRTAIQKKYRKGEWIAHRREVWPYLFLVERGLVQALKESPEGRSLLVAELTPGEMFWGISFFIPGAPMPVALAAKKESQLILWPLERLERLILDHGAMSWELTRLMIQKMQYASEILDEFAFKPITGRLARMLLDQFGGAVGEFVSRDMTLDEMAARIGTTREVVCRQLYQLADQGIINISRTEFKIVDQDSLQEAAQLSKGGER